MPPGRGSSSAFRPFHWIILSGSVKNSNTVAGPAAIRTSRSTMLRSSTCITFPHFLELSRQRQALQPLCPEALHELAQPTEALGRRPVETPSSLPALDDHRGGGRTAPRSHLLRARGRRPLLGGRREAEALAAPEAPREHPRRTPGDRPRRPLRGGLDAAVVGPASRRGTRARSGAGARPRARAPVRKVRPVSGAAADGPGDRPRRRGVARLVGGARHVK